MPIASNLYATVLAKLKAVEPTASFDVTHYSFSLGAVAGVQNWYTPTYAAGATIEMILLTKASQQFLVGMGIYVKQDAMALTLTALKEDDKVKDANDLMYRVVAVRLHPWGDKLVTYEADLVYLPGEDT